ncbi:unnamed protein product, partial [Orchesella dallaii]
GQGHVLDMYVVCVKNLEDEAFSSLISSGNKQCFGGWHGHGMARHGFVGCIATLVVFKRTQL